MPGRRVAAVLCTGTSGERGARSVEEHTVFTRVIHALFLTKILYLNLGCVIYARK